MGIAPSASDDINLLYYNHDNNRRNFSSSTTDDETSSVSAFAVIDHSKAYESSMQGRHGQQLALARLEGMGKDDLPFDPFAEEEQRFLEEEEEKHRLEAADSEEDESDSSDDSDSDDSDSDDSDDDDSGCLNPMTFSKRVGILRRYLLAASTVRGN
jgi:hypothetical protein